MHALIASPFLGEHLVVRPGSEQGIRISPGRYRTLAEDAARGAVVPEWLGAAARRAWGIEVTGASLADTVLVRPPSELGYARASWEINKGCDYDCEHCYLGLKRFEGLSWEAKMSLLDTMRDAGVLWLQITGGEPLIDAHFPASYQYAASLGMMIAISSNGSQLSKPRILDCLTRYRPYRLTVSVYGATAESYEGLTRSRGAFSRFTRGLTAAGEAGLPVRLNIIVADRNAHELDAMRGLAERYGFPYQVYTNMSPTISGGGEPLPTQAADFLRRRRPFTGCNAGHTFFHADPFGKASICKVGRNPQTCTQINPGCSPATALEALPFPVLLNLVGYVVGTLLLPCRLRGCMPPRWARRGRSRSRLRLQLSGTLERGPESGRGLGSKHAGGQIDLSRRCGTRIARSLATRRHTAGSAASRYP